MDAAKQAEISRRILAKVAEGLDVRAAVDAVCGDGTIDRLIDSLYRELRGE